MRVEVTLSLLLGVLLSPFLPVGYWTEVAALLVCLLLSYYFFAKNINIKGILLLGVFSFGLSYPKLRIYLSPHAKGKPEVSAYVRKAEQSLEQTQLSAEHQRLLGAMLLGDRKGLGKEQKALFQQAGAQHLLALSGFHLGVLVSILSFLLLQRVRFSRWRWLVLLATLFLLWWYAVMVGLPMSLLRATMMYTLFLIGNFSNRSTCKYEILSSTVFLMLLFDPQCAYDVGAQLSVMAMVGLTVFAPNLQSIFEVPDSAGQYVPPRFPLLQLVWRYFCYSLSAWLFTMPLVMFYFGQLQVWQPVVNTFLVIFVSFMLYSAVLLLFLCLCGLPLLADPVSLVVEKLMSAFDWMLYLSSSLPMSTLKLQAVSLPIVVLMYAIFAMLGIALANRSARVLVASTISCAILLALMALLTDY